jgi:hypothetical protein
MSQTLPSQQEAAPPIRAIIIQPDGTYGVREIQQDEQTFRGLVGGHVSVVSAQNWCAF